LLLGLTDELTGWYEFVYVLKHDLNNQMTSQSFLSQYSKQLVADLAVCC
jgi:hypothetical protein